MEIDFFEIECIHENNVQILTFFMQYLEKQKYNATDFDLNQLSEFLSLILSFPVRVQSQKNENIQVFELDCESAL